MTNVATVSVNIPSLQMAEAELIQVLESSLYPGARKESIKLVIGYCKAQQLDPMQKPVHIVPMQVKQRKKDAKGNETNATETVWRDVIMPGVGLYRTNAARTDAYAGIDAAEYGPTIEEEFGGEPKKEWSEQAHAKVDTGKTYDKIKLKYPEWCSVTVYRFVNGQVRPFSSGRVFWKETYSTAGNDTILPNAMWRKRGYGQIEKCAEALALRRAFPELGAAATAEEMEGKVIEHEDLPAATALPPVQGPQSKSAALPPPQPPARAAAVEREPGDDKEDEGTTTGADTGNGKQPAVAKPISKGTANILTSKMKQSGWTNLDLKARFRFETPEAVTTDRYNDVIMWAEKSAAA